MDEKPREKPSGTTEQGSPDESTHADLSNIEEWRALRRKLEEVGFEGLTQAEYYKVRDWEDAMMT